MNLKVVNTGSKGNCYILTDSNGKSLIIECGVKYTEIKKALGFKTDNIEACIVSHYHFDHSMCIKELVENGIRVFGPAETFIKRGISSSFSNVEPITAGSHNRAGAFQFIPFDLYHDCQIFGYFIYHPEMGQVIFATDTSKIPYIFKDVKTFIVEANYCEGIVAKYELEKPDKTYVTKRVKNTHLSVQKCIQFLLSNDLSKTENIILIHLSDGNSHEVRFKDMVESATSKPVIVASQGMEISLNIFK
jgi:phosphoribosyl 1,2-cyclic phosphodiesterase